MVINKDTENNFKDEKIDYSRSSTILKKSYDSSSVYNNSYEMVEEIPLFNTGIRIIDENIICKEYAPDVFAHLRDLDNIDLDFLKECLNPNNPKNVK